MDGLLRSSKLNTAFLVVFELKMNPSTFKIFLLNETIEGILPGRSQLGRTQVMDERNNWIGMFPAVGKDQGRMIELILDEDVKFPGQFEMQIIHQMCCVIAPWQGKDFDYMPF